MPVNSVARVSGSPPRTRGTIGDVSVAGVVTVVFAGVVTVVFAGVVTVVVAGVVVDARSRSINSATRSTSTTTGSLADDVMSTTGFVPANCSALISNGG